MEETAHIVIGWIRDVGANSDIDITTENPEFSAWRWAEMRELPDRIVPFKRQLYRRLVDEFGHLAGRN